MVAGVNADAMGQPGMRKHNVTLFHAQLVRLAVAQAFMKQIWPLTSGRGLLLFAIVHPGRPLFAEVVGQCVMCAGVDKEVAHVAVW